VNDLESIRAWSIGSPSLPDLKPYVYGGDQPYVPPVAPSKPSREDVACAAGDCAGTVHAKGLCGRHYRKHRRGAPLDEDRRRREFDPSFCGTVSGSKRHHHYGVPLCQPCRDAKNAYDRARRAGTTKKEASK